MTFKLPFKNLIANTPTYGYLFSPNNTSITPHPPPKKKNETNASHHKSQLKRKQCLMMRQAKYGPIKITKFQRNAIFCILRPLLITALSRRFAADSDKA